MQQTNQPIHLAAALDAGRWVMAQAHEVGDGLAWDTIHGAERRLDRSYYEGSSGIGLFLLQLFRATGAGYWLDQAARVGRDLARTHDPAGAVGGTILWTEPYPAGRWSFYTGQLGRAFFLAQLAQDLPERWAAQCALDIGHDAIGAATERDGGLVWSGEPGLLDDGGIALTLRAVGDLLDDTDLIGAAARAASALPLERHPAGHGSRWDSIDGSRLGVPGAHWPGLEFGTSGVAYACARLADLEGCGPLLDAAREGAEYVSSISRASGHGIVVPYREPDLEDLFYVGTCNGSAGVARMFYQLWSSTGEDAWLERCRGLVDGLLGLGAPEQHSPGYWETSSLCCGTAALVHLGCGLWWGTGERAYLDFAERAGQRLLQEATRTPDGLAWSDCFSRLDPADRVARPAYSIGAAGAGAALLHLHLALTGGRASLRTIDDPFPLGRAPDGPGGPPRTGDRPSSSTGAG